jgi:acetoin utilization deacetylase AcuC-like enzyme
LHFGDGTANTFAGDRNVAYYHMEPTRELESCLSTAGEDWGGTLNDRDYHQIGEVLKRFFSEKSQGKRFVVLEGSYNYATLGTSILSFLEGFE